MISDITFKFFWSKRWKTKPKFDPCPFCQQKDIDLLPQKEGQHEWVEIRCVHCNASKLCFSTYKRSIELAWNNRQLKEDHESVECLRNQLTKAKKYLKVITGKLSGNNPEWKTPKDFYNEIEEFLKN